MDTLILMMTLLCMALVVYHHVIYPLLLKWLSRGQATVEPECEPRRYASQGQDEALPSVTVIVPAYNEARYIADKLRNLAILDYPRDRLTVLVACDGCTDATAQVAYEAAQEPLCDDLDIQVIDFKHNQGKVALINAVMAEVDSDLVAFSDVSALVSVDALLMAAYHFSDAKVGVVSGDYRLLQPASTGEDHYWRYQVAIKTSESQLGSMLGAHGAFYMMRTTLFTPLEADTINDDFILPMRVVAAGYRAVYEPAIHALEQEGSSLDMDQQRRRRIGAGNLQQLLRLMGLLSPKHGGVAFTFASSKALRVLMPVCMLLALLGSAWLAVNSWIFALLFAGQVALYAMAAWVALWPDRVPHSVFRSVHYLVSGHVAAFMGALTYVFQRQSLSWSSNKQEGDLS